MVQRLIGHVVQRVERHRLTVRQRHRGGDRVGAQRPGLHRVDRAFKRGRWAAGAWAADAVKAATAPCRDGLAATAPEIRDAAG